MNKHYEYVLQQNSYDCGIASIITILLNYGIKPSREEIISKISKKQGGYSAYDLVKVSKSYGIEASGRKTNITSIKKFPVIAHTIKNKNMFHFIVIFEMDKNKNLLKILDPEEGLKIISIEEFNEMTTNIFLIFEGNKRKLPNDERFKKELKSLYELNKKLIFKTVFLSITFVIISLIFNYYLKVILTCKTTSEILKIVICFCSLTILKNAINYLKNKLILDISIKIDKDITEKVTNHIFHLPYEYFVKKSSGELITIIEDIENFKEIVIKVFILCSVDLVLIFVILLYMSILNIYTGLILMILIFILLRITKKYQYKFNDLFIKFKNNKINYASTLINYVTSFETIKNLNIAPNISKILNKKYHESLTNEKEYMKKHNSYNFFQTILTDMFYVIYIGVTSYLVLENSVEFLDIVLFSSLFFMVTSLLTNINENISLYKVYQTSTDHILDCLNVETEIFGKTKLSKISEIEFRNIKYEKDEISILNNINLKIKTGEKVYITGKSGVGKSTLMKLLLKYYKETDGEILIDNINIKNLPLSFIRENITYIGQNEELFKDTIMNNLKLVESDEQKIKEISNLTLLDNAINKNCIDYNYFIEESGCNLSGGEKKKIILTRGIAKMKNVLILDEVFNEMSIEEEKEILENLFSKYKDKIIIMISHRNSNKDLFDKKYILKRTGDLIELKQ